MPLMFAPMPFPESPLSLSGGLSVFLAKQVVFAGTFSLMCQTNLLLTSF